VKTNERFKRGKIYIFKYRNPFSIYKLKEWDSNPIVLSLGQDEYNNDIGINLNYIPNKLKIKILDKIMDQYSSKIKFAMEGVDVNAKQQKNLNDFDYNNLKRILNRLGFQKAIRTYKHNLKQKQFVVSYESWPKITFLNIKNIIKNTSK
ncbi:MAG: hypothetical protein ACOC56_03060, partial [Atribacterota bacterium]